MSRATGRALGLAALLAALSPACRRAPAGAQPAVADAAPAAAADDAGRTAASGPIGPRCRPADMVLPIDGRRGDHGPEGVEIGDAVQVPGGYAVGVVHRTAEGREAAVFVFPLAVAGGPRPGAAAAAKLIDLGPTLGDAPPPRLATRGGDLVAAAYARPRAGDGGAADRGDHRTLAIYAIPSPASASAAPATLLTVPQQRDDSLAFDVAFSASAGVVVWDEASAAAHGVIRAAEIRAGSPGAPRDVSPPGSDAEAPRVVPDGAGFAALWIARRAEPQREGGAPDLEATGEPRSFGWVEMARLDARGAPAGPARALTPATGHVSAYDVEALPGVLLVVARDDGEAVDGSGGALLRVRVAGDSVEPPVEFPGDGLGRGAPELVDGLPRYLSWVGPAEQARLLPLDATGAPVGPPSAEDALDDARPLRALGPSGEGAAAGAGLVRLLVAASSGDAAELRVVSCARGAAPGAAALPSQAPFD